MAYRDDLEQAHRRIEQLETELREARSRGASRRVSVGYARRWERLAAVAALSLFTVGLSMVGATVRHAACRAHHVSWVDEVVRDRGRFEGRVLRVRGVIVKGSVVKGQGPCHVDFVLAHAGQTLPVMLESCTTSFSIREGRTATVVGELGADELRASAVSSPPST